MDKSKFGEGPWGRKLYDCEKIERLKVVLECLVDGDTSGARLFAHQAFPTVEEGDSGCRQSEPTLDALRAQLVLIREMLGGFMKTLACWLEDPGVGPDTDKRSALVKRAIENLSQVSTNLLTDVYYLL
jgi:hypothetical protein